MNIPSRLALAVVLLAALPACYTPRDVRPAAVAAAKADVERDLPALAQSMRQSNPDRAAMISMFKTYLSEHDGVYGMAYAPGPVAPGQTPPPALYVYRKGSGFAVRNLALPDYNYPTMEWYRKPLSSGGAVWSAPYFDDDGGDVWMQTYSIPLSGGSGGVLTNDVPVFGPHSQ